MVQIEIKFEDLLDELQQLTDIEVEINNFYSDVENRYDELINKHTLGDCLVFKGQKI